MCVRFIVRQIIQLENKNLKMENGFMFYHLKICLLFDDLPEHKG